MSHDMFFLRAIAFIAFSLIAVLTIFKFVRVVLNINPLPISLIFWWWWKTGKDDDDDKFSP
jgi:hypothetical protein